jgi:hypothetical protein
MSYESGSAPLLPVHGGEFGEETEAVQRNAKPKQGSRALLVLLVTGVTVGGSGQSIFLPLFQSPKIVDQVCVQCARVLIRVRGL